MNRQNSLKQVRIAIVIIKMDPALKLRLMKEIEVYKSKFSTASSRDVLIFLRSGAVPTEFAALSIQTLLMTKQSCQCQSTL